MFLDRDGVINRRLPGDYVKTWEEFEFLPGVLESIAILSRIFDLIIVVTNQQGIGKGLMTEADLDAIHEKMIGRIRQADGRIDAVFHCPDLAGKEPDCRKPSPYMAFQAKKKFTQLKFSHSVMVGDTLADMQFGAGLGMTTVLIETEMEEGIGEEPGLKIDYRFPSLKAFAVEVSSSDRNHLTPQKPPR